MTTSLLADRRVLLVIGSTTGGVGRHVYSLTKHVVDTGARVVVCGPAAAQEQFDFRSLGARFAPVEISAQPQARDVVIAQNLRRITAKADIVHAHGLRAGLFAALGNMGQPTPLVVTWHNLMLARGVRRALYSVLEPVVAFGADVTLCASSDLVHRVEGFRSLARHRIDLDVRLAPVAAPPLAAPQRDPAKVRAELGATGRPLVVTVARLHPQKGLDTLVEAARLIAAVQGSDAPLFVIAGDGPLRTELQNQISQSGAPVELLGHRDDVSDLLAAADVGVLASQWEARSLFAQEVMRAGLPLVCTNVGGLPELVGDAGILVPPNDAPALAEAISGVVQNPAIAEDLANRSRQQAAGFPTEESSAAEVCAVYEELLASADAAREQGR